MTVEGWACQCTDGFCTEFPCKSYSQSLTWNACPICGQNHDTTACPRAWTSYETVTFKSAPQGWECPKCGNIYAPFVMECSRCNAEARLP